MISRYFTALLVVFVALAIYFLYIDSTYREIEHKKAQEVVLDNYLSDAKNAQEKLDSIASAYNSFPQDSDARLSVMLPDRVDPIRYIIDATALAKKRGLTLRSPVVSIEPSDPSKSSGYLRHTISFRIISTYSVFQDFLNDVQSSLALHEFSSVSFSAPAESLDAKTKSDPRFAVFEYQVELTSFSRN